MKKIIIAPWGKQLLTSILGTAIGVGLTFTADRMMENNKQQRAQRETALMAVCDIDEIIQQLKDEMHSEDELFQVAMYVSTHQEQIDAMREDTIDMTFEYLYDDPAKVKDWTIDTKENAFNSGMEARKNLGNNKFYENMQSSYYARRSLMKKMEQDPVFRKPVRSETYEQDLQHLGYQQLDAMRKFKPYLEARKSMVKKFLAQGETMIYIKRYFSRREAYEHAISNLQRLNRENKMLMNISKEDIEEYIRQNENIMQAPTADLIVGSWEGNTEKNTTTYVFHADSTVELTLGFVMEVTFDLKEEHAEVFLPTPTTFSAKGRWELTGDTLKYQFDGQTVELQSFEVDWSYLPEAALERVKGDFEEEEKDIKDGMLAMLQNMAPIISDTCVISFDKSGSTMVCSQRKMTPPQLFRME